MKQKSKNEIKELYRNLTRNMNCGFSRNKNGSITISIGDDYIDFFLLSNVEDFMQKVASSNDDPYVVKKNDKGEVESIDRGRDLSPKLEPQLG